MAPRKPGLPEGTDHIIDTNIDLGDPGGGGGIGGSGGGSTGGTTGSGTAGSTGTGGSAFQFDKNGGNGSGDKGSVSKAADTIASSVRDQISTLKGQAGDRARSMADDGKRQATDFLQTIAKVVEDAASSVEDRLGNQYAGFGRRASESISSLASTLDQRSVDDLLEDASNFMKRSPAIAIGVAAVAGFAVARVVRSAVAEMSSDRDGTTAGGDGGSTGGTAASGSTGAGASAGLNATSGAFGEQGVGTAGNVGGTTSTGPGSTGGTGNAPTY